MLYGNSTLTEDGELRLKVGNKVWLPKFAPGTTMDQVMDYVTAQNFKLPEARGEEVEVRLLLNEEVQTVCYPKKGIKQFLREYMNRRTYLSKYDSFKKKETAVIQQSLLLA